MAESMKGLKRSCRCGEVTQECIGTELTLMGWVAKRRNLGGMIFVDTDWGDYYEDGSGWFWCSYSNVIAWMPFPKPYSPQIER